MNKKRSSPDNLNEEESECSKRKEMREKNKANHHYSFSFDSSKKSRNITINLRGNSCPKPEMNISDNSSIIYYIIDKGNYFKKENRESHENKLEYNCFIEKSKNNEIYFYHYIKYNIDDNEDNIFCYRCCDSNCRGLITLNYSSKNNEEKIQSISEHTISNKAHCYIKHPTYGYQIYIDFLKKNSIKYIQLLNNEIENEICYKNLNSLINELKMNKKNIINNIKCIHTTNDNAISPNENEESQTEKETRNNNKIENDDENDSRKKSENDSVSQKNMEERESLNESSQIRNNNSSKDKNIFEFFNSRKNNHLAYGKEVYYKKLRNDCNPSENRKKWNQYIIQKYGENISIGTAYSIKRDEKENIFYRYRPFFCLDHKKKNLKYCCLEVGCEGKVLFDLKLEKFEVTNEHNLPNKSHILSNHPKHYEIMQFFHENTEINDILILREYQGSE